MSTKCEIEILTLAHYMALREQGFEFEGQSYLFWEYVRVLSELRKINPDVKFLLENVMMGAKWQRVLTRAIGINPICINSSLVSAQNRERLYWTNIGVGPAGMFDDLHCQIPQPKNKQIFIGHILEDEVSDKYFLSERMVEWLKEHSIKKKAQGCGFFFKTKEPHEKANCLNQRLHKMGVDDNYIVHNMMPRSSNTNKGGTGHLTRSDGKTYCLDTGQTNVIEAENFIRRLTPIECERLQTVPDNYTNHVSDTQRYKMLGNGWTVDVIAHIFSHI